MAVILFILSVLLILYHHIGYPLLLKCITKRKNQPKQGSILPLNKFVFVIPMHNEALFIGKKILNFAEIVYPRHRFEVWLLNDGSTDKTLSIAERIAKKYPELTIKIRSSPVNQGKVAWLNQVIPEISNENILFFSDVSASLAPNVLLKANQYFNNPQVGAYCTQYQLLENDLLGEKSYWNYQSQIKIEESKLGTPIGYHGTGYAIRKELWIKLPANTINDDFVLPMQVIAKNYPFFVGVYDPSCASIENEKLINQGTFAQRVRVGAGNVQQVLILSGLLFSLWGYITWMFFSGKFLRIFMPWLMIVLFFSTVFLSLQGSLFFNLLLWGQIILCFSVVVNYFIKSHYVELVSYFIKGQFAMFLGWFYFFKLNKTGLWKRTNAPRKRTYIHPVVKIGKWVIDKFFALIGLVLLIFVSPIIAILIKLSSPGPVFYKQLRVGLGTEKQTNFFYLYKFRTMKINSEFNGARWTAINDPRVFWLGYFLRKTHLDELPQVLNILKGDMSLIGPRPERLDLYPYLVKNIPYYSERLFEVLPGLTGLSQITYGYDRTINNIKRRIALDHVYTTYLTNPWLWFKTDMKILYKTITMILSGREP